MKIISHRHNQAGPPVPRVPAGGEGGRARPEGPGRRTGAWGVPRPQRRAGRHPRVCRGPGREGPVPVPAAASPPWTRQVFLEGPMAGLSFLRPATLLPAPPRPLDTAGGPSLSAHTSPSQRLSCWMPQPPACLPVTPLLWDFLGPWNQDPQVVARQRTECPTARDSPVPRVGQPLSRAIPRETPTRPSKPTCSQPRPRDVPEAAAHACVRPPSRLPALTGLPEGHIPRTTPAVGAHAVLSHE